jgi:class 3 adenylate cyclase
MKCQSCNAENAENARFCNQCGTPFVCPSCGALKELGSDFCSRCGTVLSVEQSDRSAIHEGERRHLSVMFSDIVGSTALSERLDPEDLQAILRNYRATCSKVIGLYEGHVAQYIGDGIPAYFGYPTAHEDDARPAIQAGLGAIEAMAAIRERLLRETGAEFGVRVGIHTGLVVIDAADGNDVLGSPIVGNTTNIAARIQSAAEENTLIVSSATHKLTRGFFEAADYGVHKLKGISHAVQLYRIVHESTARSRLDAASGLKKSFRISLKHDQSFWRSTIRKPPCCEGPSNIGCWLVPELRANQPPEKRSRTCAASLHLSTGCQSPLRGRRSNCNERVGLKRRTSEGNFDELAKMYCGRKRVALKQEIRIAIVIVAACAIAAMACLLLPIGG